jgi:hydroxylamine dehydrogenase
MKLLILILGIITILTSSALYINSQRPIQETKEYHQSSKQVSATGKCIECHKRETSSIVHQFNDSKHSKEGMSCLDCHESLEGQESNIHKGFKITKVVTSKNCKKCHLTEYDQFVKSRHAASSWAAVHGSKDFTPEQIEYAEKYHKGSVNRPKNTLAYLEGKSAITKGCNGCHSIGKPNRDGSIGSCTECHSKHNSSVAMARRPKTCAQCHMGPDHSQYEIYSESKHGAYVNAFNDKIHWDADPKNLTTKDFPAPVCATCHMSGLEGMKVTHNVTERLSYWLFAPVSKKRPTFQNGRDQMTETCLKCHSKKHVNRFFREAEDVLVDTNKIVKKAQKIVSDLRKEGHLTKEKFDEPIEFLVFDLWHYFGRTAKHGAFMGGADFVQWHGNYELKLKMVELEEMAHEIREKSKK